MALIVVNSGFDSFVDIAGTLLSSHVPTDGSGGLWQDIPDSTPRLVIPASGRVQPNGVSAAGSSCRLSPNSIGFAGSDLTQPRYVLTLLARTATVAVQEKIILGVYNPFSNTFFGAGLTSVFAEFEGGGDAVTVDSGLIIYDSYQGGNYPRFPGQSPHSSFNRITGGVSMYRQGSPTVVDIEIVIYIDEYQIIVSKSTIAGVPVAIVAYPRELRTARPLPSLVGVDTPHYEPCLYMRSSDITAAGGRVDDIFWSFCDFTPQSVLPQWEPLEGLFIARVDLDFQSALVCRAGSDCVGLGFVAVPSSEGPYLVSPPTRYRDVEVSAAMIVVDNGSNPAYLDVSIGSLNYEIAPFTRFQLALPVFSSPILVRGGGNRGKLFLYSEVIAYAYN